MIDVKRVHLFQGHTSGIFDLKALNEHEFVSAGGDGQVVRWSLAKPGDGQLIAKVDSTVYAICVDGERLLVAENGRGLHLLNYQSREVLRSVEIKAPIFAIERIDDRYLVGTGAGELFIFDLHLNCLNKLRPTSKSLRAITYNEVDIACAFSDNSIRILDKKTLEEKSRIENC